jgi:preprotein translocase subunit SecF
MLELFKVPKIQFSKYTRPAMTFSIILIVVGVGFFISRSPRDKYDLDFAGGALVRVNLKSEIETQEVQRRLAPSYPEAVVLTIGVGGSLPDEKSTQFELQTQVADETGVSQFRTAVVTAFADLLVPPGIQDFKTLTAEEAALAAPEAASPQGALSLTLTLAKPAATDSVRQALVAAGFDKLDLKPVGAEPSVSFQVVGTMLGSAPSASELRQAVANALERQKLALSDPTPKYDFVGPKVVKDLKGKAILATVLSLILI